MKPLRRPYHHGNLREALLDEAERTVEAEGAGSLTLRELSRRLGVSHTSPRRHFADKQALLDALAQRGFERFGAMVARAAKDRGQSFDKRLTQLARAHVRFALKHPSLFRLMLEAKNRPDPPAGLLEASERVFSIAAEIFTAGQKRGEVIPGDPARIGLVGYAAMQGLIAVSTNGKFKKIPVDVLVGEVVERLILGLRPRR
jgi:AcrR family transcriptional regulator